MVSGFTWFLINILRHLYYSSRGSRKVFHHNSGLNHSLLICQLLSGRVSIIVECEWILPHVTQLFYVNGSFRRNGRHARTLNKTKILHSKEDAESHYKTGLFVRMLGHVDVEEEGMVVWMMRMMWFLKFNKRVWNTSKCFCVKMKTVFYDCPRTTYKLIYLHKITS